MKRFHVHVAVEDLLTSIQFYSTLFDAKPTVQEPDYAKWMLDDPRINFAISSRGRATGINHLGFQVDTADELAGMKAQLEAADGAMVEQSAVACCYARSDKYWITDPSGIAWETFHSLGTTPVYDDQTRVHGKESACCVPLALVEGESAACCIPGEGRTPNACCA